MFKFAKRIFDLLSALLLLIVISPMYILVALLVWVKIGKPIMFKQLRTGMNQKKFYIKKFRSMTEEKDENSSYLPDEIRLTKFGRFLRSSSLDELPELVAIIKGDMSVIGPRPMPTRYDQFYTEREKLRFKVRGGLIPPEVLYNNVQPTWDEQLEYEAAYAENLSLGQDVKIFFAVFKGLFTRADNNYGEYVRPGLDEERKKQSDCINSST